MAVIRRLLLVAVAVILSWAGVVQPGVGALASPAEFVHVYAHDGHHTAVPTFTTNERGPPTTFDSDTDQVSDDPLPLGALARSEGSAPGATTTYNARAGGPSALPRSAVAANTAPKALPSGPKIAAQ